MLLTRKAWQGFSASEVSGYEDLNLIIAHMGGGISSRYRGAKVVDEICS